MGCAGVITRPRRYKYVVEDRDRHGNVRTYLRVPGRPKVRLRAVYDPANPEAFEAEYRAALISKPKEKPAPVGVVAPGSVNALCVAYFGSAEYKRLDARGQRVRRQILDRFRQDHGGKGAAALQPRHLVAMRDERADKPEAFNGLLKALRAVFKCAVERGLVADNPAAKVRLLPSKNPEGFHAWTAEEIEQYEARHPVGTKARLALALLLYTAQRRSDVVLFGRQHVDGGWLRFTQQKNRARKPVRLSLPIIPELQRIIDATPSEGLTFLTTQAGGTYSAESFGNRFREWCREARLPHCSAHGLRKAAASRLAELGCSELEIMAITGHRTMKEVAHYTRAARQRVMAENAFGRLSEATFANEKSHSGPPSESGTKTQAKSLSHKGLPSVWCPGKDSNLHDLAITGT